jgi:hypothetical protein
MPSINVTSTAAVPILGRLLTATLASRDAFAHAAGAIRPATLAARLADEAEHQRHIARYLRSQLIHGASPQAVVTSAALVYSSPIVGLMPLVDDPGTLLGECLRVLDACARDFGRVDGPPLSLAQVVALGHHQDHMRVTSNELSRLRSEYATLPADAAPPIATSEAGKVRRSSRRKQLADSGMHGRTARMR